MGGSTAFESALVEEAMKKSAICWVQPAGSARAFPVWHVWLNGAAYLVSGGDEQPLPGIATAPSALVIARSKDTGQRLVSWEADVQTLARGTQEWVTATTALLAARLNLPDAALASYRWAADCTISRLAPTGRVRESPGRMPSDDLAAAPVDTPATTRGPLPKVLHRRQRQRPRLS